jgi:hypothetical protein
VKEKIDQFKKLLQLSLNQKSIKVFRDGHIIITYRYKPKQILVHNYSSTIFEENLIDKLKAITNIKYKIIKLQKEPSFCYNTYVKLISSSSATSRDKIKSFLNYFEKDKNNDWLKTSYKEITVNLIPSSKEDFQNFLLTSD